MTMFLFSPLWVYANFLSSSIFSSSISSKRFLFTIILVLSSPISFFAMINSWRRFLCLNYRMLMNTNMQLVEIVVASLEFTKLLFMNCSWVVIEFNSIYKTLFPKQNLSNVRHKLLTKILKFAKLITISYSCRIVDWSWLWGGLSRCLMSTIKRHLVAMI